MPLYDNSQSHCVPSQSSARPSTIRIEKLQTFRLHGDHLSPRISFKEFALQRAKETEFDVTSGDFSGLEIRAAEHFYYFYETRSQRLIKSFLLREGPKVDTMCDVLLTKNQESFTPRLTLWKKDKSKGTRNALTESEVVSEGRIALIKARVDIGDCHQNFWKLIAFLQAHNSVDLPPGQFRIASQRDVDILRTLEGQDKEAVLNAVKTYLGGQLTEADVQMLLNRRKALDIFNALLNDSDFFRQAMQKLDTTTEGVWQKFFEQNTWIFGYGLKLVACSSFSDKRLEQITTGANVFTGGGKRSDALMRTRGFLQTLLFTEIKRHDTDLLMAKQYRRLTSIRYLLNLAVQCLKFKRRLIRQSRILQLCTAAILPKDRFSSRSPL